jgi:predicted nucleic-acid-binding protein
MTGVDTNILARYFINDAADAEASKQRVAAQRLVDAGEALFVPKSVTLELEWVMRGYYGFAAAQCSRVLRHLLAMLKRIGEPG